MRIILNGWQRLWIVALVMWLLPVMVFSYELWPTTADILKDEIYAQLKPDDGRRLTDYTDGTVFAPPQAPVGKLTPYKGPYTIEPPPGPVRDIDGHKIQFYEGVSLEDMNQTTRAYADILHHVRSVKRAAFIVKMFGLWMVPMIGLYLTGWAIAWVRRGFRQVA